MHERNVRYAIRGYVIAALGCCIAALWGVRLVIPSGAEGFYQLLIYLAVLAAPGWFAWRQPDPRTLSLWGAIAWVATIVFYVPGEPYAFSPKPADWSWIAVPLSLARGLILFGTPLLGMALIREQAGVAGTAVCPRVRRIAHLAVVLGALALVVTYLPPQAGRAMTIGAFIVTVLAPAAFVMPHPTRDRAYAWMVWALVCTPLTLVVDDFALKVGWQWPILRAAVGAMLVLLVVGLPLAARLSRSRPADVPEARVV